MEIKNVVVDSNFLIKDYNLNSHETAQLIKIKDYYKLNLIMPDVVYDECIGNYRKDSLEARTAIAADIEKYKKLLVNIKKTKFDHTELISELSKLSDYYKPKLDKFIKNNSIKKLPYPNVSHRSIVDEMYQGSLPFRLEKTEVGYKDFLILSSIKEYLDPKDVTVILTRNAKDFCAMGDILGKKSLMPVNEKLDMGSAYVVETVEALSAILSKNLDRTNVASPWSREDIEKFIKNSIEEPFYNSEVYGLFMISPNSANNVIVSIKELQAQQIDVENGYVEITGIAQIQMDCSFELNQFVFSTSDTEFVFYDAVIKAMKRLKFTDDDFWKIQFDDYNYCHDFEFSITDYDYEAEKSLEGSFLNLDRVKSLSTIVQF